MRSLVVEFPQTKSVEETLRGVLGHPGVMLFQSGVFDPQQSRYSYLVTRPFLTFRSFGADCEIRTTGRMTRRFGNPWSVLELLLDTFELPDEFDQPFPLGGCFGIWGYDLKNHLEPRLSRRVQNDLALPDCHLGFYDSLVAFDHHLGKTWVVATGFCADGERSLPRAQRQLHFWLDHLRATAPAPRDDDVPRQTRTSKPEVSSSFSRAGYLHAVRQAQDFIWAGHVYQVNLAQRLALPCPFPAASLYERLLSNSPAPFAAYVDAGDFQVVSSSPELFLHLSGRHVRTRPIKGTRPRSSDAIRDTQLGYELQTSSKEMAELIMITDLLRNDVGRIAEYGTVHVPELVRLERYSHVQHLVSTIEARLRDNVSHLRALAACFPGGSITGAPKIRAMEIIDELEPVSRGLYTGAIGYIGFNQESQLSILIRAAVCQRHVAWFHVGAGIVADSDPEAEWEETLAKARGLLDALNPELPIASKITRPFPPTSVGNVPGLPRGSL
jgi:para-aminobenzoate synthetase component I